MMLTPETVTTTRQVITTTPSYLPLLEAIALAVATIATAGLIWLQRKLAHWIGVKISAETENLERTVATGAIHHAEEWCARKAVDKMTPMMNEKYVEARKMLVSKCPWLSGDQVDAALQSALARMGYGAAAEADKIAMYAEGEAESLAPHVK